MATAAKRRAGARASRVWCLLLGLVACGDDAGLAPTMGLQSIAIVPPAPTLPSGATTQLSAIGVYSDDTTADLSSEVAWFASPSGIAAVTPEGLLRGGDVGNATLFAQLGDRRARANVAVTPPVVTFLEFGVAADRMPEGTTQQLLAFGLFSDGVLVPFMSEVAWTSSAPEHVDVTPGGLARARSPGIASIAAARDGVVSEPQLITVTDPVLASLRITAGPVSSPDLLTLLIGQTVALQAIGTYTDGRVRDVTPETSWFSADLSVLQVTHDGLVSPASFFGGAFVIAVAGDATGTLDVRVARPLLTSLEVAPANPQVAVGLDQQFTAVAVLFDGATPDLTAQMVWESSDPEVATISNARGSQGVAHMHRAGTTVITATLAGSSQSTTLTVIAPGAALP